MALTKPIARMTVPEYVAFEEKADVRHELLDGEVFAMAGGTPEHAALMASVSHLLSLALRGKPCRVFSSDLRVRIHATRLTTYPDVTVVCGKLELDADDRLAATNPIVIVEVLSETTASYDRGAKAAHYRRVPSLMEYVLVAQDEQRIEVHRRVADRWEIHDAVPGQAIPLVSIGVELDVAEVYRDPLAPAVG